MSESIQQEKVAYIAPSETTWCVSIRDGTGLADGIFTTPQRYYYDTVEEAYESAQDRLESGTVDEVKLNVVAKRHLENSPTL